MGTDIYRIIATYVEFLRVRVDPQIASFGPERRFPAFEILNPPQADLRFQNRSGLAPKLNPLFIGGHELVSFQKRLPTSIAAFCSDSERYDDSVLKTGRLWLHFHPPGGGLFQYRRAWWIP